MGNLIASDIIAKARVYAAEPNPDGRWSDADILSLGDDACTETALRLDFPEATYTTPSVNAQQEYSLPEVIAVLRVYVAGQLIFPTDIPALEGEQIEVFDQTGTNWVPKWMDTASGGGSATQGYPVPNDRAAPVSANPYYPGQRPEFYLRGGNIGFVPPAAAGVTIQLDAIPIPVQLSTAGTQTTFPHLFLPALAHKTAALMYSSDQNDAMATIEEAKFEKAVKALIEWKRNLVRNKPRRTYLYPYRLFTYGPFSR